MNPRRLYRCRHDRQLAGVAAGMAEYLEIDPTLVRILWILSAFLGGFTIVIYIILAFVIPLEPAAMSGPRPGSVQDPGTAPSPDGGAASIEWPGPDQRLASRGVGRGGLVLGVLLVVFGAIAMVNALIPGWTGAVALGPAFVVALGVALLVGSARRTASER